MHYLYPRSQVRREPWKRGWRYFQVVITTPEWGYEVIPILRSLITDVTHPAAQERLATPPGSTPSKPAWQALERGFGGQKGFQGAQCKFPFPSLSIPRTPATQAKPFVDIIEKAALSSQLVNDPECWSCRGLNTRPPAQQTRRRFPNWGYQVAVKECNSDHGSLFLERMC